MGAVLLAGFCPPVQAAALVSHSGAADPTGEGWVQAFGAIPPTVGPVVNDLGSGLDAWIVDDNSALLGSGGGYHLYGMIFDSRDGRVDFFVDNMLWVADYNGHAFVQGNPEVFLGVRLVSGHGPGQLQQRRVRCHSADAAARVPIALVGHLRGSRSRSLGPRNSVLEQDNIRLIRPDV